MFQLWQMLENIFKYIPYLWLHKFLSIIPDLKNCFPDVQRNVYLLGIELEMPESYECPSSSYTGAVKHKRLEFIIQPIELIKKANLLIRWLGKFIKKSLVLETIVLTSNHSVLRYIKMVPIR